MNNPETQKIAFTLTADELAELDAKKQERGIRNRSDYVRMALLAFMRKPEPFQPAPIYSRDELVSIHQSTEQHERDEALDDLFGRACGRYPELATSV